MSKIIEFDEQCRSCKGTGLFRGMAEGEGIAVVCYDCKGTGCYHFKREYDEFTGKKQRGGIQRVIEYNPGFGLGEGNGYVLSDFGGMTYEDWISGKPFVPGMEMRHFVCPAWWYQGADYKKKPDWCECMLGGTFRSCPHFHHKDKCWARWDQEFGSK